jgi:hypothetical protein
MSRHGIEDIEIRPLKLGPQDWTVEVGPSRLDSQSWAFVTNKRNYELVEALELELWAYSNPSGGVNDL